MYIGTPIWCTIVVSSCILPPRLFSLAKASGVHFFFDFHLIFLDNNFTGSNHIHNFFFVKSTFSNLKNWNEGLSSLFLENSPFQDTLPLKRVEMTGGTHLNKIVDTYHILTIYLHLKWRYPKQSKVHTKELDLYFIHLFDFKLSI